MAQPILPAQLLNFSEPAGLCIRESCLGVGAEIYCVQQVLPGCVVRQRFDRAGTEHRSENVAFDAVSCATVPVLSEGGPAKWLKNKNQ